MEIKLIKGIPSLFCVNVNFETIVNIAANVSASSCEHILKIRSHVRETIVMWYVVCILLLLHYW